MKSVLGALSVGSGVALAVAPQQLERLYGLPRRSRWTRALGLRDIAVGLWLLRPDAQGGLAARAAADLLDFGLIWREHGRRPQSRWTGARLMTALLSASLAGGLRISARAPRQRWWRRTPTLVRRQPALALGVAFLLGVTLARRRRAQLPAPTPERAGHGAPASPNPPPQARPNASPGADPILSEAPATTGVGSPIGDAPYASGSRY